MRKKPQLIESEDLERLNEIKAEIHERIQEANEIIKKTSQADRFYYYGYAQIIAALDDEHEFGSNIGTLQDCIDSLSSELNS